MRKNPWDEKPTPKREIEDETSIRLNKYLAHCGIASRRAASVLIQKGFVKVNDQLITEPGYRINPNDEVKYKGKNIKIVEKFIYILLNKPKGVITTTNDEKNRKTVMDIVGQKNYKYRIYPVGRLDRDTTGLLILTNDGDLTKKLSHPSHEVHKLYHVLLDKDLSEEDFNKIKQGFDLEDGPFKVDNISYAQGKSKNEIGLKIHIGRNRIVRRIFSALGYKVKALDRVVYAGLTKKDLPRGRHRILTEKEVIFLKHFS